jgi:nitroreductase
LLVVTNSDIRSKIAGEAAGGQAQITDGSHLLVAAAWDNYMAERIDSVVDLNVSARGDLPMLRAYYTTI